MFPMLHETLYFLKTEVKALHDCLVQCFRDVFHPGNCVTTGTYGRWAQNCTPIFDFS